MLRIITFELRRARDIMHGGRKLASHIATLVEPRLTGALEEAQSLPKGWVAIVQLILMALLSGDRKAVLQAETDLLKERRKEAKARKVREVAKSALHKLLGKGRQFLEGALERGASSALVGLDPNLPQEAIVLLRHGTQAVEEFSRPDFQPETVVINGEVSTPQEFAGEVQLATDALQVAEDQLADQVRDTQQKLDVKENAVKRLSKENGCCARILEELYVLAGAEFHAERLRSSSRARSAALVSEPDGVVDPDLTDEPAVDDTTPAVE